MHPSPVLLIGWDAADWHVIHELLERSLMPHTRRLIERGVMGDLATLHPVLSPMLWATIATGKRPFEHGILGFTEPTPDGGGIQPVSQRGRRTKALWNILHQRGLRQHVISWWPSHPVEPIRGVMVSNHFATALGPPAAPWPIPPGMVHPAEATAALAACRINPNELLPEQVLPFVPRAAEIDQNQDRRLAAVQKIVAEAASVQAAALWAMDHGPWDFMAVYFDAIDHLSHGFMKYRAPRRSHLSERDCDLYGGVVDTCYQFHDLLLGALLAKAPPDTRVIVCSDHGFHSDHLRPVLLPNEPAGPALEHRDLGVLIMAGPGLARDRLIHGASVLDITPTVLALYGLPVGEDMDGRVLADAFESPPQVERIPSWDAVPGDAARLDPAQWYDPIAAKAAMDRLVSLGYVAAPGADQAQAVATTVRELRWNLARSYMDAARFADAAPILADLYAAAPGQFRFGVQLALCLRALGVTTELRELVERLSRERLAAARAAQADLAELTAGLLDRPAGADQPGPTTPAPADLDPARLDEPTRRRLRELRLLARFDSRDLDYLMGWVLSAEGDPARALAHLHRAERADARAGTRRPGLLVQIGETLLSLRRLDEAERAFGAALTADPGNPHAHLGLARVRLLQRRAEDCVAHALQSIAARYRNALAHYVLGLGLWRLRQYQRAAEAMRVAVGINPNFARAHRFLARHALRIEQDVARSQAHWAAVRACRRVARDRHLLRLADAQRTLDALLPATAPDVDQEAEQVSFDAAPRPAVPTDAAAAVPARWQECVVIVSGLPRSGTSLAMQMLAAGGIQAVTDGQRAADIDNPRGYFEHTAATRLHRDHTAAADATRHWLHGARGRAVKVVAQLLPHLPPGLSYRVLFMERDLDEVLRSQAVMLARLGGERPRVGDAELKAAFQRQLAQVKAWLAHQPHCDVLTIAHAAVIADPAATAARIAAFLGSGLEQAAMAAAVDPALHRQRAGSPGPASATRASAIGDGDQRRPGA